MFSLCICMPFILTVGYSRLIEPANSLSACSACHCMAIANTTTPGRDAIWPLLCSLSKVVSITDQRVRYHSLTALRIVQCCSFSTLTCSNSYCEGMPAGSKQSKDWHGQQHLDSNESTYPLDSLPSPTRWRAEELELPNPPTLGDYSLTVFPFKNYRPVFQYIHTVQCAPGTGRKRVSQLHTIT